MPQFDIVFEKLAVVIQESDDTSVVIEAMTTTTELDEIDELRRLSAEIQEPERPTYTTT